MKRHLNSHQTNKRFHDELNVLVLSLHSLRHVGELLVAKPLPQHLLNLNMNKRYYSDTLIHKQVIEEKVKLADTNLCDAFSHWQTAFFDLPLTHGANCKTCSSLKYICGAKNVLQGLPRVLNDIPRK